MSDLTMVEFLKAVEENGSGLPEMLAARGHHPKVIYAKALKAASRGYTDYGVVADRPWLTIKGKTFLAAHAPVP